MIVNTALADILDRDAADREPDALLAALVDHGVFVPVGENGSVLFLRSEDGTPAIPGYVSEACCAERLPQAAAAIHCDALRLLDIAERTGVEALAVHSVRGWARVPVPLVYRTLAGRGQQAGGERLKLSWSTHPVAVALRDALARRVREFPAVRTVWVSRARRLETGAEHLMLHIAVDEPLPSSSAQRMTEILLAEDVVLGEDDPKVGMLAINTTGHAESIAELESMGLDTVRFDRATGRVDVISREYDAPPA
ncbi:hypothetical protein [Streptomyces sp. HUAS TT20]|uniref:hypothetical protein n=1 Tax=Streptomyces sp. HUAS TT20 TaxID=3447509 RepID=UPI0021D9019B|nr:hypothetical protein [Streptomyces sp. HUAS 15-9]UXY25635.1 hypothetical protein N8I87_03010 [Streptomyces sp. HUAS 15-9]